MSVYRITTDIVDNNYCVQPIGVQGLRHIEVRITTINQPDDMDVQALLQRGGLGDWVRQIMHRQLWRAELALSSRDLE